MNKKNVTENNTKEIRKSTVDFNEKPISIKLTPDTEEMLDYIMKYNQVNKSNAIRMAISRMYWSMTKGESK
jgi:hypothetical protein